MESAARVFAGELCRSDLSMKGDDGDSAAWVVTPCGAWCRLLFIAGALTEVRESGDMLHCRVADPTGTFVLTLGGRTSSLATAILGLPVPSFVSVSGRAQMYRKDKEVAISIRPEHIQSIDRQVRDQWVVTTAEATLCRLEQMFSAMKGTCSDDRVMVALRHYTPTPGQIAELARMAEDAVQRVKPSAITPAREEGDTRQQVMKIIGEHQGPRGIAVEDVIAKAGEEGISQAEVLAAIESLIVEDECYQPQKGYVRPL
jgi:uncharacterized protein